MKKEITKNLDKENQNIGDKKNQKHRRQERPKHSRQEKQWQQTSSSKKTLKLCVRKFSRNVKVD